MLNVGNFGHYMMNIGHPRTMIWFVSAHLYSVLFDTIFNSLAHHLLTFNFCMNVL